MRAALVLAIATVAACSPYDPNLQRQPFNCGTTAPQCPDGYTCQGTNPGICTSASGGTTDAGFVCADDHTLEPNDTIAEAFQTPVATTKPNITFSGLAICPAGDRDTYKIDVTVDLQDLEVDVIFDPGTPLQVVILNSVGTQIVAGAAVGNTTTAKVSALPMADSPYFAQVSAPPGTENNYKLSIAITGP